MAQNFGFYLKKSIPYLFLGGGTATGFAILYPNTVGLDSYRNLVAVHNPNGKEEKVDIEFIKLAEEMSDKLQWTEEQREKTRLFPCMWIDFIHKGSCNSRWGAAIGVPGHLVPSLDSIDKATSSGRLGNFPMDFTSPSGQNLLKSLEMVAGDNAKKFAVAKEMCIVDSYHEFLMAGVTAVAIPAAYFTARMFQMVSGFYSNRFLRRLSYAVIFPTVMAAHVVLKDASNCRRQEKIDDELASLGPEMAQGGADYYSALLLRNQSLLSLCGKQGPKNITYYGNVRSSWRRPEPLLTERRDKMLKFTENRHGVEVKL